MNILFVTADQWRGDCAGYAGHPLVKTPNLDALAADGVAFLNHYAQAAPCSPARAALYTGLYQMNNRVCRNGSPLADRFDNIAKLGAAPATIRRCSAIPTSRPTRRTGTRMIRTSRATRACYPVSSPA